MKTKGFASGDPENDAYAVRKFVQDGHQIMLSQSFAKVFFLFSLFTPFIFTIICL
jgi:aspartate aminotransferase